MRIARWIADLASLLFGLAAAWELFGPLQAGHWAAMATEGIAAENMLRLHVFGAVTRYVAGAPAPTDFYCHHPYGLFILQAVARLVAGHHPATVRLVAVASSALTPPLLYQVALELWKDARVAVVAVLAFVLLPIDLAFAGFAGLEVPTICFGLLFSWGTLRLLRTGEKRALVWSLAAAIGATETDWPGIVLVGSLGGLAWLGARVSARERALDPAREKLFRVWLLGAAVACLGCVALYVALWESNGQLPRLGRAFHYRSANALAPLAEIFGPRRRMWISWMFTPAGLVVLGLALPLSLARVRRNPGELVPIAWLFTAAVQYFVFRQGADIHIFWGHYFGVSVALGLAGLAAALLRARRWHATRLGPTMTPRVARASKALVALVVAIPLVIFARVSLPLARQSRLTQGRFDEGGLPIDSEADASVFAAWSTHDLPEGTRLARTSAFPADRHVAYSIGGFFPRVAPLDAGAPDSTERFVLMDTRRTSKEDLLAYAHAFDVEAVGPFWRLDRAGHGRLVAMPFIARQPGLLERYFVTGTDLIRFVGPGVDPWATWEWRDHLGLPGVPPTSPPATFDEVRVAHNAAIAGADPATAAALRSRVMGALAGSSAADFTGDVHLLGVSVEPGPAPVATLLWLAGEGFRPVVASFVVKCKIVRPPALWPAAIDFYEKDMAPPTALPPALWKPRYLYVDRFVVRHRVGVEACEGSFTAKELHPTGDRERVPLFTMD